jgi:hypothetical protein
LEHILNAHNKTKSIKNNEEPNGSFFISTDEDSQRRIFVANWHSHKLINLRDMKTFFAEELINIFAQLEALEEIGRTDPDNDAWLPLSVEFISAIFRKAHNWCNDYGLRMSAQYAAKIHNLLCTSPEERINQLEYFKRYHVEDKITGYRMAVLGEQVKHLQTLIRDELELEMVLHVPFSDMKRYRQRNPFGNMVTKKWEKMPGVQTDIQEANKCFVLRRYTATVFHVMRVIEWLVQQIAHNYGVKPKVNEREIPIEEAAWDKLLTEITNKLGKHCKANESSKDTRMREICVSLDSIRGIWRNPVAHPHHQYTKGEARAIFSLSKEVTKQVAALI